MTDDEYRAWADQRCLDAAPQITNLLPQHMRDAGLRIQFAGVIADDLAAEYRRTLVEVVAEPDQLIGMLAVFGEEDGYAESNGGPS